MIDRATGENKGGEQNTQGNNNLLNNNNVAHDLESPRPGSIEYGGEGNKRTFSQATAACRPPLRTIRPTRLTVEQINSGAEDKEERNRLTFNAIA